MAPSRVRECLRDCLLIHQGRFNPLLGGLRVRDSAFGDGAPHPQCSVCTMLRRRTPAFLWEHAAR